MFLKACSNMGRRGRSWAFVAVGGVVLVFLLDDWPDTIPLEGGRMLPKRGGNGAHSWTGRRLSHLARARRGHHSAHPPPCFRLDSNWGKISELWKNLRVGGGSSSGIGRKNSAPGTSPVWSPLMNGTRQTVPTPPRFARERTNSLFRRRGLLGRVRHSNHRKDPSKSIVGALSFARFQFGERLVNKRHGPASRFGFYGIV